MTVNFCPATVTVPLRAPPAFGPAVNEITPLPGPQLFPAKANQGAWDKAGHAQAAAAVNEIAPLPVPLLFPAMAIQGASEEAVQAQPAAVDTVTGVPAPPPAPIDWLGGASA